MNGTLVVFLILVGVVGLTVYWSIKNDGEKALEEEENYVSFLSPGSTNSAANLGLAPGWYPNADGTVEVYFDGKAWGDSRPVK